MIKNTTNRIRFTATMVEPTGVPARIEIIIPVNALQVERIAAQTVTERNDLHTLMADSAGKMTSAEIRREPTKFMASTMMTAIMVAMHTLNSFTLRPVALEKSSSKVTANSLL